MFHIQLCLKANFWNNNIFHIFTHSILRTYVPELLPVNILKQKHMHFVNAVIFIVIKQITF